MNDMASSNINRNYSVCQLPDDVLVDIISRLPAKTFFRSKCVSKAWLALVSDEYYCKKLPLTMSGLFIMSLFVFKHEFISLSADPAIDTALSFLPPHKHLAVVDTCNGMVLCSLWDSYPDGNTLYICNPVTTKWAQVSIPHHLYDCISLAFDPRVSRHFFILGFMKSGELDIFSSKTGERTYWIQLSPAKSSVCFHNKRVFLNGLFHMIDFQQRHILAVDLENRVSKKIELPEAGGLPCLGHSGGQLNLAMKTDEEISIWMLKDYSELEWTLKCRITVHEIFQKLHSAPSDAAMVSVGYFWIAAFHPDFDTVFFQIGSKLIAYHVNNAKLEEVRRLSPWYIRGYYVYSPCFVDAFGMEDD